MILIALPPDQMSELLFYVGLFTLGLLALIGLLAYFGRDPSWTVPPVPPEWGEDRRRIILTDEDVMGKDWIE